MDHHLTGRSVEPEQSSITFERASGALGAFVHGLDVSSESTHGAGEMLRRALHEHGVLIFESDAPIDDESFHSFASLFGQIEAYPYQPLSSTGEVTVLDSEESPADVYRANQWHTDGSLLPCPPQAALLTPDLLPTVGGDTIWASMYAAYEALSSPLQRLLEGLQAVHSTAAIARHFPAGAYNPLAEGQATAHPAVLTDPVTGRRMLYVNSNYTERLVGLKASESARILDLLFEHIQTPEFQMRLRWQPHMVVVWEERVTQHRAVLDYNERRTMRRITINGDRPTI